jgi:hypothetical protein
MPNDSTKSGSVTYGGGAAPDSAYAPRRPRPTDAELAAEQHAQALEAFNQGQTNITFVSPKIAAQDLVDGMSAAVEQQTPAPQAAAADPAADFAAFMGQALGAKANRFTIGEESTDGKP